jgi:SsrA-binding protein
MTAGKTLAVNRKARFEYEVLETVEAGLVLLGTEIKAMREGRASIADAYVRPEGGELWLMNAHIGQYSAGNVSNHDPTRPRKVLLHKSQMARLSKQVAERGLTLVPLRLYVKRHMAKIEVALVRGRRQYDKRQVMIERDRRREAEEAVKRAR